MINNSIEGHDLKGQFEITVWMFSFVGRPLFFHSQTFQARLWNISCWAFMWHDFLLMNRCISIYILYLHTYIYMLYWQKYVYIYIIDVYTYIWHGFGLSRHWMIFFIHVIHSNMDIRLSAFDLSWRIGMWRTILASQKSQVKRHGCIPHQPYHGKKPPSICCYLKPPRNPTKYGDFPWKKPSHIFTTQSFAKLCGCNHFQDPLHAAAMAASSWGTKVHENYREWWNHDPTGFFLEGGILTRWWFQNFF